MLSLQSIPLPDNHATIPAGSDETADFINDLLDDTLLLQRNTMSNALQHHRLLGCLQYVSDVSLLFAHAVACCDMIQAMLMLCHTMTSYKPCSCCAML